MHSILAGKKKKKKEEGFEKTQINGLSFAHPPWRVVRRGARSTVPWAIFVHWFGSFLFVETQPIWEYSPQNTIRVRAPKPLLVVKKKSWFLCGGSGKNEVITDSSRPLQTPGTLGHALSYNLPVGMKTQSRSCRSLYLQLKRKARFPGNV